VEIAAPPMNLLGPQLVRDLISLIQQAEADSAVKVLVFRNADPDYFISHVDVTKIKEYRQEAARLTGEASIASLFHYLSASRLVTTRRSKVAYAAPAANSCWRATCALPRASRRFSVKSKTPSARSRAVAQPSTSRA